MAQIRPNIPTGPCLGTVVDDSGEILPIIPGMILAIITDHLRPENAMPLILISVAPNKIVLGLKTSDGGIIHYQYKCTSKVLANKAAHDTHRKSQN